MPLNISPLHIPHALLTPVVVVIAVVVIVVCLFVCFFYRGHLWNTQGTYQIGFAVDLSDRVCYLSIYVTVKEDACSLSEKRIR